MKNARNNPTKISENKLPGVKSQSARNKEEGTSSQRVFSMFNWTQTPCRGAIGNTDEIRNQNINTNI